jgi:cobalt-zinc-cadmium efflux system outer membrane protein
VFVDFFDGETAVSSVRSCAIASVAAFVWTVSVNAQGPPGNSTAQELTFEQVLAAALRQHPQLEAASARADAARAAVRTARVSPNPMLSYMTEGNRFPGQAPSSLFSPERALFASVPLDSFVQKQPRVARAEAGVRASEADLVVTEREIVRTVAAAYYRVALGQAAVTAAEENRLALDRIVEYLRARVEQGASPEAELIRAEVERDQAATDLVFAQIDLVQAQGELAPYLGPPAGTAPVRVKTDISGATRPALPPLQSLLERASATRPEITAARARLASAEADVGLQRKAVVRDLGASFGVKRMNGMNTMMASVNVAVPLFDSNRGEIDRATAERLAAERDLEWTTRQIAAEVRAAYEVTRRLSEHVASLEKTFLSRAEESARIALATYQEGAAPLMQALDATRALAASRLSYSRMVFAERESLAVLRLVSGDDLRVPPSTFEIGARK